MRALPSPQPHHNFCTAFYTLTPVLLMYCSTYSCSLLHLSPSFFFSLLLFCSSDCDELSHLKCFLSLCIPGGFQSPSIFPCLSPPPSTESPHFLCTHLPIPYLIAVVLSISPSPVVRLSFSPPLSLSLHLCLHAFPLFWKHYSNHNHALRPLHHLHLHPAVNR